MITSIRHTIDFPYQNLENLNKVANEKIIQTVTKLIFDQLYSFFGRYNLVKLTVPHMNAIVRNAFQAVAEAQSINYQFDRRVVIKTVFEMTLTHNVIKIKDNGCGFKNLRPGAEEALNPLRFFEHSKKSVLKILKDEKGGLEKLNGDLAKINGAVLIKNRKNEGAAITLKIPSLPTSML